MNLETRLFLALLGGTALAAGCSTEIVSQHAAAGAGGTSSASSTASATTATGAGGEGGTSFVTSATASTGPIGDPACLGADLFFDILGDGAPQHFDASCSPRGHFDCGGPGGKPPPPPPPGKPPPPPAGFLILSACTQNPPIELVATMNALPGSSTGAAVATYHAQGTGEAYTTALSPDAVEVVVTGYNDIGGVIEGSYKALVTRNSGDAGPDQLELSGQFRVCHTENTCFP
jgi:hypothetical protein